MCDRHFMRIAPLRLHLQQSHADSTSAFIDANIDPHQNRLFSRYSTAGEYVFQNVITATSTEPTVLFAENNVQDNDNSFYSDIANNYEYDNDDIDDDFDAVHFM